MRILAGFSVFPPERAAYRHDHAHVNQARLQKAADSGMITTMSANEQAQRHRLPASRRAQLASLIEERGEATVTELVDATGVSADTIRRDLDDLARRGLLTRTHGGATHRPLARADQPFDSRMHEHHEGKQLIGETAAALLTDGQTLLINGGTTTLAVAKSLHQHRDLTVVTNNLRLPAEIDTTCVRELYLIGGHCRLSSLVTIGPVEFPGTEGHASHAVTADIAIIGVGGISAGLGLSTTNLHEARMMREMIDAAEQVLVVADASKFGRNTFVQIAPLDLVDAVITDREPPAELAAALRESDVKVILPG
jgi:DeoR family fructose operon transcriptional repressor